MAAVGDERHRGVGAGDEVAAHEAGDRLRRSSVAIGIAIRIRPAGTSHCHPIHSSVKPWRISAPLPNSAAVVGSAESARVLEHRKDALAAAIAGLVEQAAVAARRIDRLQQVEVGAELDQALRVRRGASPRSTMPAVLRQPRVESEVDRADELLVGAGGAEGAGRSARPRAG